MIRRSFFNPTFILAIVCIIFAVWPVLSEVQPARSAASVDATNALDQARWRELEPGLWYINAASTLGIHITALKISPEKFEFSLALQDQPKGQKAADFAMREDAAIAVNGGFFAASAQNELRPVGLLVSDGQHLSRPWQKDGGYLVLKDGKPQIVPTLQGLPQSATEAVQSRPVIIEPGQNWAMGRNQGILKNRTLVCVLPSQETILVLVSGRGMSLFEAGWLLRDQSWGGWFGCDAAIAMDGGGSSQLYYDKDPAIALTGATPVNNALVVKRRHAE